MQPLARILCLALLCAGNVASAGELRSLFTTLEPGGDPQPAEAYAEVWQAELDIMALRDPASAILVNLPGRGAIEVRLVRWSPREGYLNLIDDDLNPYTIPDPNAPPEAFSWRWYGRGGDYTVALTMVHGIVAGRVWTSSEHWGIAPTSERTTQLGLVNRDYWKKHPEVEPIQRRVASKTTLPDSFRWPALNDNARPHKLPNGPTWDSTCSSELDLDAYHNVDVLVMYTPSMVVPYGNSVVAMTAAIQMAMDDGNDSLANSRISTVHYVLAGVEAVPTGFDYETADIVAARDRLSGIVEQNFNVVPAQYCVSTPNLAVQARRNAKYADVVALARNSSDQTCGVAWLQRTFNNFDGCVMEPGAAWERFSYLVFNPKCSEDDLNLPHELGHVLGMEHDPQNAPFAAHVNTLVTPSCPWSFAHKQRGSNPGGTGYPFRTVMAYYQTAVNGGFSEGPPPCVDKFDCPQVEAYSSTALEYRGSNTFASFGAGSYPRLGVVRPPSPPNPFFPESNAWDTLQRVGAVVADFRARPDGIFTHGFE